MGGKKKLASTDIDAFPSPIGMIQSQCVGSSTNDEEEKNVRHG